MLARTIMDRATYMRTSISPSPFCRLCSLSIPLHPADQCADADGLSLTWQRYSNRDQTQGDALIRYGDSSLRAKSCRKVRVGIRTRRGTSEAGPLGFLHCGEDEPTAFA